MSLFSRGSDGVIRFVVRVTPRARRDAIDGIMTDGNGVPMLKVAVSEPPEGGKANKAVLALLAKAFDVPRSSLTVQTGVADRRKLICLQVEAPALARLELWAHSLKS